MARTLKTVLTNFSSGELNPLLATRIDTPAYANGAKQCRNFALLAEGGVMRRPGTSYLATSVSYTHLTLPTKRIV